MELINDIPRLYTGLAEWAACLVVLLNCRRKVQTAPFIAISAAAVVLQCGFLMMTDDIEAGIVWILVMIAAFFFMCLYIFLCADISAKGAVYKAAAAFLHAEFAASLEWQLYFWLLKRIRVNTALSALLLAIVYAAVFSLFFYLSKRHITDEFIKTLSWKEVTSMSILMLFIFAFSNLSFFLSGSPFSGRLAEDIFAIRTLADGFGVAVYWGFQISISELLTQKELYAMRHVLSSQYEQFRYYQESEEMIHMMQHDLNILSAKLRKARQLDVRITCVADGALLNKLHVTDICTIFGNALDNALESVVMIPDPQKRLIHVSVSAQKNFIFINISNTLGTDLIESEDSLLTTKEDKKNHGYGLKGIRYAVGKYGGHAAYKAEDRWFRLNILIPM